MARRLAVLAALLVVLARPGIAQAETDILGGFTSGVSDFVSPSNEQVIVTPEKDYIDSYEPIFIEENSARLKVLPDNANTIDYVNNTVDSFNDIRWQGQQSGSILQTVRRFFLYQQGLLLLEAAIGIVFVYWGLRKVIRMIMSAWRKGHASI